MKKSAVILLVSFLISACSDSGNTPPVIEESIAYLALGDSYTIGASVEVEERWPNQLARLLFPSVPGNELRLLAQTGWTTADLTNAIDTTTDFKNRYDLVSLLIGVNNQFQGRSLDNYEIEFRALLEKSIEFAGDDPGRVFVVSIPDYAYTTFGGGDPMISQEIDEFNAANKAITDEYGIQYFNITPISRLGLDQPELVATDGLHPSGEQYRRWVELMVDDVRMMLQ